MPSISSPSDLTAVIGFALPDDRLDHDGSIYLTYIKGRERPSENIRVPVTDLRPELESEDLASTSDQLYDRGYAVFKHQSEFVDELRTKEGTQSYLDESAEQVQASKVGVPADRHLFLIGF